MSFRTDMISSGCDRSNDAGPGVDSARAGTSPDPVGRWLDHLMRRRWAIITGVVLLVVLLLAVTGIGWYYSSELLVPDRQLDYPDRLAATDPGRVTLAASRLTEQPGIWGIQWTGGEEGALRVGGVDEVGPAGAVRPVLHGAPPTPGTSIYLDPIAFGPDPSARGIAFSQTTFPSRLGGMPAWFVPGTRSDTWVIAVHGRGSSGMEALRILPTLQAAGLPVLAISYRNDEGAPASPDGIYHLGESEWQDVEAAVDYATSRGAQRVVLYAWSMGGAIVGAYLDRAANARSVQAAVLDSPVLDWRAVLALQTRNRDLPTFITPIAEWFISARTGIDFDRFDLVDHPPSVRPPTLLFHGSGDTTVPVQPARDLAAAAPRLAWPLTYVEIPGAEHTAGWNVDPGGYEHRVAEFLAANAAAP
jgi:alpha-beta hydrolase superfamily lysophospholipase